MLSVNEVIWRRGAGGGSTLVVVVVNLEAALFDRVWHQLVQDGGLYDCSYSIHYD